MEEYFECYYLDYQGPCEINQVVKESGDGVTGLCKCSPSTFPMKDYDSCSYPFRNGPCPEGQEVQIKNGLGICIVNYQHFMNFKNRLMKKMKSLGQIQLYFFQEKCYDVDFPDYCLKKNESILDLFDSGK